MMKYKLIKKWHASQVEEVGHVFEEDEETSITTTRKINGYTAFTNLFPHEIALLVDAGYLEKQEKCTKHESDGNVYTSDPAQYKCKKCGEYYYVIPQQDDPQLELWTEEPPEGTIYFFLREEQLYEAKVCCEKTRWVGDITDFLRLKTNNCHKTQQSTEEALKRLMS